MAISRTVTCTGPVNIAVIKYWGKRHEELILPTNSSLSATLNQSELKTTTTVSISTEYTSNRMWLNGTEESMSNPRLVNVLAEFRKRGLEFCNNPENKDAGINLEEKKKLLESFVHISSNNNFPTAAGLASSASGYATLVYTLAKAYDLPLGDLSQIARVGSGSACRSLFGGWAKWNKGEKDDGSDSFAEQTHKEDHWEDMQILVLVVSDKKKGTSSTSGMSTTVKTSSLFKERINNVVEQRMVDIQKAITDKNFEEFGKITMMDSNQFHSVCLDTYPPIFYLTDVSRAVIQLVTKYNALSGSVKVAYTFDAGPNAVLFATKETMDDFLPLVHKFFQPSTPETFYRGLINQPPQNKSSLDEQIDLPSQVDALTYAILTSPGPGPIDITETNEHLLNPETGLLN